MLNGVTKHPPVRDHVVQRAFHQNKKQDGGEGAGVGEVIFESQG